MNSRVTILHGNSPLAHSNPWTERPWFQTTILIRVKSWCNFLKTPQKTPSSVNMIWKWALYSREPLPLNRLSNSKTHSLRQCHYLYPKSKKKWLSMTTHKNHLVSHGTKSLTSPALPSSPHNNTHGVNNLSKPWDYSAPSPTRTTSIGSSSAWVCPPRPWPMAPSSTSTCSCKTCTNRPLNGSLWAVATL